MNRKDMLNKLQEPEKVWDMVVVGGGATGLGVAESYLWLPPYLQNSILFLPLINISVTFSYCYNLVSQISSKRRCRFSIRSIKGERANEG